jgi:hypothetical protein
MTPIHCRKQSGNQLFIFFVAGRPLYNATSGDTILASGAFLLWIALPGIYHHHKAL